MVRPAYALKWIWKVIQHIFEHRVLMSLNEPWKTNGTRAQKIKTAKVMKTHPSVVLLQSLVTMCNDVFHDPDV